MLFRSFAQDELLLGSKLRWVGGLRWDNIEPIGSVVSPRTSLLFSPLRDHTLRISFNRAFRAPTVINNHLEATIVNEVRLPPDGRVYQFPSRAHGNLDLKEGEVDALEAGYVGAFAERLEVDLSVYRSNFKDGIDLFPASFYSASNPPPGWPYPPAAVPQNTFPEVFTYRNYGSVGFRGVEVSLRYTAATPWSASANYSYQAKPVPKGVRSDEINHPPQNRVNLGLAWNGSPLFASGNLNFVDKGFWADVLDARYWGPTKAFTQVNASAGVRLYDDRIEVSVLATNLFDARVQEHVFGDIMSRKIAGGVRFHF